MGTITRTAAGVLAIFRRLHVSARAAVDRKHARDARGESGAKSSEELGSSGGGGPRQAEPAKPVEHADERTIRRIAESQNGGLSSEESAARYASGENPGGLHHGAVRHADPLADDVIEEPEERKERRPRHERHMSASRRGA